MANELPVPRNLILNSLTADELGPLEIHEAAYSNGAVLIQPDEIPKWVYFPHHGAVVSMVRSTEDGSMVESGVIGGEGLFSLSTVITEPAPPGVQAMVQIEGHFSRVETRHLRERFRNDDTLRERVLSFTRVFLDQVTQNLVCNRLHTIEPRLAKWLLMVRDRMDRDELHLTHDFLAHMLGIHRPGVSIAVRALEMDGLIAHSRNMITLRDRQGLEERACECFKVLHADLLQYQAALRR